MGESPEKSLQVYLGGELTTVSLHQSASAHGVTHFHNPRGLAPARDWPHHGVRYESNFSNRGDRFARLRRARRSRCKVGLHFLPEFCGPPPGGRGEPEVSRPSSLACSACQGSPETWDFHLSVSRHCFRAMPRPEVKSTDRESARCSFICAWYWR